MASPEAPADEVSIRRTEILVPQMEGPPKPMLYITYTVRDLPPGLLTILKGEWTLEKEVDLIRKDVEARRKTKPEILRL